MIDLGILHKLSSTSNALIISQKNIDLIFIVVNLSTRL